MALLCFNSIRAGMTNSEWKEIAAAFANDRIDWTLTMDDIDCDDQNKEISFETKWSPVPWEQGKMAALSRSYPSALFYYSTKIEGESEFFCPSTWFCNGIECGESEAESNRQQAYQAEAERFTSATDLAADGVFHRVEIMPDSRVAADGENRFGECEIFAWKDIRQISCGNWHTVGLKKDGTVIACGSNTNGQCDVSDLPEPATAVSCGRYHTAILLGSGKVIIKGNLEREEAQVPEQGEFPLFVSDFPLTCNLVLDKNVDGWEQMNERIEHISVGDELALKTNPNYSEGGFEVCNLQGEKIGYLRFDRENGLKRLLKKVKASVAEVTPLSQRRKGSKYAVMTIRLDHISEYRQTSVETWPPVARIKSVFDAVIGVTSDGKMLVDGFCPCSEADLRRMVGLTE